MGTQAEPRRRVSVLGAPIDAVDWEGAVGRVAAWADSGESRTVAVCNAHSVVTASDDPAFYAAIVHADLATPDGAPVAWLMRRSGAPGQQRIDGPGLMWRVLERAACEGHPTFFYGGRQDVLDRLVGRVRAAFPDLIVAGAISPPFRVPTPEEDAADIAAITASGARIVFVSLGCPKQELWMADHRGRVDAVMIGVGAAFDFYAGTLPRAPRWVQSAGLEWMHRLAHEPRRLWRRYLSTNSAFLLGAARQLLARRARS